MVSILVVQGNQANLSKKETAKLYQIMIDAYALTEIDIWGPNYVRLSWPEFIKTIEEGKLFVARLNGEAVGSIYVTEEKPGCYSFGVLSADFKHSGKGIGRHLIETVEHFAKQNGASIMSLEILRPAEFDVEFKGFLHNWYSQMGYQLIETMSFLERKPDKIDKEKLLVNRSVFDYYEKKL